MTGEWIIHGALIFGMVVVVPMAKVLSDRLFGRSRVPTWTLVASGVLASASFFVDKGSLSAGLCNPWVITCTVLGLDKVGNPRTLVARLVYLLPHAYLVFGGAWLVISRYGARPLDFPSVIVELTAVHFHFAGFVAPVIIAMARNHQVRARGPLLVALILSLVASPLTAIGFVYSATIGAVGAVTFMLGLFLWSVITVVVVVPSLRGSERWLMLVAAGSVLVSMTLAAIYSIGVAAGESWIEIPTMARTHGVLNAIGFSLCGAGAWLLATNWKAEGTA
jgi:hypothetical protein